MVEGVQFYLDQVKGEMGGRKVELVIEDDASNPDTALQKARRLVEQGNCHMLMGDLLANTGLAVANPAGAAGSVLNVVQHPALNHRIEFTPGVLAEECGALLREFFVARR